MTRPPSAGVQAYASAAMTVRAARDYLGHSRGERGRLSDYRELRGGTPKLSIVTTSWDDGDPSDIKIAELLHAACVAGTFYVPITNCLGRRTLTPTEIGSLFSEGFEVGAHGISHRILLGLTAEELATEVRNCKDMLEQILGDRVSMFCYPKGRYDANVLRHVEDAGYAGARTTRMLSLKLNFRPFEMPTTLQAYPHRRLAYVKNLVRGMNATGLYRYLTALSVSGSWVELGRILFDQVLREGGIWHLYGHSQEIEELGMWGELEQILDYVCNREGVIYASNGQVLQLLQSQFSGAVSDNSR